MAERPFGEVRFGKIKGTIWRNVYPREGGGEIVRYAVKFARLYKENGGDTQWKTTESFGRDDLPVLREVAQRAWSKIYEAGNATSP